MGGDNFSVVAPARLKILCVPVGQIQRSRFQGFVNRLAQESVIRLGDVSPSSSPHGSQYLSAAMWYLLIDGRTATFSPLAFPNGRVLFDIATSAPLSTHLALSPFEVYRRSFIVVAVADGQWYQEISASNGHPGDGNARSGAGTMLSTDSVQALLGFKQHLASDFSSALVHQTLVFDCNVTGQRLPEDLTAIPTAARSTITTIKTVMCDLTSQLLAEMASFARSLQELPFIETPKVPRQIIQRPLARYSVSAGPPSAEPGQPMPPSLNEYERNEHRMSMPAHLLANLESRSSTPESRPMSPPSGRGSPPAALNGTGSAPSSPPSRAVDRQRPMSRDRASMQGFGSNSLSERERTKVRGRTRIIIGSLYLLAGRWPDAVKELVDGATTAKVNSDHVWHAKALDYLLVICLLHAWSNIDFQKHLANAEVPQIPPLLYAAAEKPGQGSTKVSKDTPMGSHTNIATSSAIPTRDASLQSLSKLLPELLTTIQNLQSRAWMFSEDRLPQLSFSETGLRFSHLLMIVDKSDGSLTDTNLDYIVFGSLARQDGPMAKQVKILPRRTEIAAFLFRSFPSTDTDESLTTTDRTRILARTASILAELGLRRKKAYVLKELLQGLIPALVEARKRRAAEMGVHPAASLASLDAALIGARDTASQLLHGEDDVDIQSFLTMVCRLYGIAMSSGHNTDKDQSRNDSKLNGTQPAASAPLDRTEIISQRAIHQASSTYFGAADLKIDILRLCRNVCEALPDLKGVLHYSAELLRTSGSGVAPGPDDGNGSPSLPIEDQLRLWNNISRTVGVGRQLGLDHLAADYWDEFLVRAIKMVPSTSNSPIPHAKSELDAVARNSADTNSGPFLYNPFSQNSKAKAAKPLLVAGEEATFWVTLQNLYDFDLEIESIRLTSDSESCSSPGQSAVVGPYSTQSIYLTATPSESGCLSIDGCIAKIRGCHERWFPIFIGPWSYKPRTKDIQPNYSDLLSEVGSHGVAKKDTKAPQGPVASSIDLDVIETLPHVVLRNTTLSQSAIMLLEGETRTFTITLYNASKTITADLVLLTFEDSMATQLQAAMVNKDLPLTDLLELSLASSKKPLRWRQTGNGTSSRIEAGRELTLELELDGRPGLSSANIQVSYGHIGVPYDQIKDRFYTRQISYPLTITVNASIDITRTDVLPFSNTFAWQNQQRQPPLRRPSSAKKSDTPPDRTRRHPSMSTRSKSNKLINHENRFQSLLSRIGMSPSDKAHCLLCLDCRNSWPHPLSISIQVRPLPTPVTNGNTPPTTRSPKSDTASTRLAYTVHESVQPGHTKRILLLLPRLRLSGAHLPIPSLDPKQQFVVSSSPNASYEVQLAARENHWYREALLDSLHATWSEESTSRTGTINLRNIRLSARMVETLKLPELEIEMRLSLTFSSCETGIDNYTESATPSNKDHDAAASENNNPHLFKQIGPGSYVVPLSQPLTLTTVVTNHSSSRIHLMLRLQPLLKPPNGAHPHRISLDTSRKFLVHGLLQQVLPVLEPGDKRSVKIVVYVLGRGTWSVGGVMEEVRLLRDGQDGIKGERERRIWSVEEAVEITAVEPDEAHESNDD
ncbi:MAG: hypothetical protein Q9209_007141 [Squamulea sp. 1 TL-2023]